MYVPININMITLITYRINILQRLASINTLFKTTKLVFSEWIQFLLKYKSVEENVSPFFVFSSSAPLRLKLLSYLSSAGQTEKEPLQGNLPHDPVEQKI